MNKNIRRKRDCSFRKHSNVRKLRILKETEPKSNQEKPRNALLREEGGGFRMGNTCIPVADSF